MTMPPPVDHLKGLTTAIFIEIAQLAAETNSVNFGQGFPDADGPAEMLDAAVEAIRSGHNQYPALPGIPELRQAISDHQRRFYGLEFDPVDQILVTAGATEATAAAIHAFVAPGDEVVVFEPLFTSYTGIIAMAHGVRRTVPLRGRDFSFDPAELRAAVTDRAKLILLNTPHNPTGKVFTRQELAAIAEVAIERNLLVVTDEIYEHLVFEGEHVPIATLPGMRDRTITISGAGKTFNCMGWRVGWACGPAEAISAMRTARQFFSFINGAPFQYGVARALALPDDYYRGLADDLRERRDLFCAGLERLGYDVRWPAATYFTNVDVRGVGLGHGEEYCRELPRRVGVAAVPSAAFYDSDRGDPFARFAFCRDVSVLREGLSRLERLSA